MAHNRVCDSCLECIPYAVLFLPKEQPSTLRHATNLPLPYLHYMPPTAPALPYMPSATPALPQPPPEQPTSNNATSLTCQTAQVRCPGARTAVEPAAVAIAECEGSGGGGVATADIVPALEPGGEQGANSRGPGRRLEEGQGRRLGKGLGAEPRR